MRFCQAKAMTTLCGCRFIKQSEAQPSTEYLPQLDVAAHATILSTASKTLLSQTFLNPSPEVLDCQYVFPLFDGVSVVGFTCQIGNRTITGVVKEKTKAREVYEDAKARGEVRGSFPCFLTMRRRR